MNYGELPIPTHFDPRKATELFEPEYYRLQLAASEWATQHSLKPTSVTSQRMKISFIPIDVQVSFCFPGKSLFVAGRNGNGAVDDSIRTCEFIYKNISLLDEIVPTMDTHTGAQIFFPRMWQYADGSPVAPFTIITEDDVKNGKIVINPAMGYAVLQQPGGGAVNILQRHGRHYTSELGREGKFPLMVWDYHTMLGSIGHCLVPLVDEAIFFFDVARQNQAAHQIKGGNPLSENYSVIRQEVLTAADGKPLPNTGINKKLMSRIDTSDVIIFAGQAASHCLGWTVMDVLDYINQQDPAMAHKIYVVEDLTSSVVTPQYDFTDDAKRLFDTFDKAGMHIVKSTTPIAEWPGVDSQRLLSR
jgi:nicotinamidase-related amidase